VNVSGPTDDSVELCALFHSDPAAFEREREVLACAAWVPFTRALVAAVPGAADSPAGATASPDASARSADAHTVASRHGEDVRSGHRGTVATGMSVRATHRPFAGLPVPPAVVAEAGESLEEWAARGMGDAVMTANTLVQARILTSWTFECAWQTHDALGNHEFAHRRVYMSKFGGIVDLLAKSNVTVAFGPLAHAFSAHVLLVTRGTHNDRGHGLWAAELLIKLHSGSLVHSDLRRTSCTAIYSLRSCAGSGAPRRAARRGSRARRRAARVAALAAAPPRVVPRQLWLLRATRRADACCCCIARLRFATSRVIVMTLDRVALSCPGVYYIGASDQTSAPDGA
jgi:hypothetical protein